MKISTADIYISQNLECLVFKYKNIILNFVPEKYKYNLWKCLKCFHSFTQG